MNMQYSLQAIRNSLSSEKKKEDSQLAIYIHRPISYPVTYLLVNMGLSAWTVSVFSAFVAFTGCLLICMDSYSMRWVGIILLHFWAVLDCVDGNIARVTKTQSDKGAFMDAESGYMVCAFIYIAFGMAAYHTTITGLFRDNALYIFVGAIASISDVLARLIHQKYVSTVKENSTNENTKETTLGKLRKRISTELGIAGFVLFGSIVAQVFNLYDILILFYWIFNLLSLLAVFILYSKKAKTV